FSPDLHVLHVLETAGMRDAGPATGAAPSKENAPYYRPDFPITWARRHGEGRVFYTALGHREDVWTNPVFQQMLFGALAWAVGNVDAAIPPTIRQVTPRAWELPPVSPNAGGPARVRPAPAN
ncbi:MAG TPA: ThuA domain-containing protein, partial [Opitutaceae bacterium]|nr:ThuA domain-containing protein [Opitutaceae bacterium]